MKAAKKKAKVKAKAKAAAKPKEVIVRWDCMNPFTTRLFGVCTSMAKSRRSAAVVAKESLAHTEVVRVTIERF